MHVSHQLIFPCCWPKSHCQLGSGFEHLSKETWCPRASRVMPWSRIWQTWPNPGRPQHSSSCTGLSCSPKCHFAMRYWFFLEASHGLCELLPALQSTAMQPSTAPQLCCITLAVLLKVTVPKTRAGLCVWLQEDRRTVAQQALAA